MTNKLGITAIILSLAALIVSVVSLTAGHQPAEADTGDVQYVMYLGTNDKDTNEPVFSPEEAQEQVDAVLTKHFEGFTIQEAKGGWTNEDGTVSHEYTLVIYLSDTTMDAVRGAADDLIQTFNQSSILIQANHTSTEFYSGSSE